MTLSGLAHASVLLLILQMAGPAPEQAHFRFERQVSVAAGTATQACAVLDGQLYAHAGTALNDLRLYGQGGEPVPFAILVSNPVSDGNDTAKVLNLGSTGSGGHIRFDLQMPPRSYTQVDLDLQAKDFLASAKVYGQSGGSNGASAPSTGTFLGEYTLFDLTAQHLSRATTLNLPESNYPYLHVELTLSSAPGVEKQTFVPALVAGATVPPSREAQMLFTTVAEAPGMKSEGGRSVATIQLPARVPVERVEFVLPAGYHANFSRPVRVAAQVAATSETEGSAEQLSGEISRVQLNEAGHAIHEEHLTVPATLGANLQSDAMVKVSVENGDDQPLPFKAVRLEMRQRKLCFDPPAANTPLTLAYGDSALHAPIYDYARVFRPASQVRVATLEPEQPNRGYSPRADARAFTERHPELLWIALLLVVGVLGVVAFRSVRRLQI